jgi:endogenous inhibitor of DNA gyrase (YacG/DUF329 family)
MKVTQVKCPKCELPLYMEQQDEFFYCSHCGTIHTREMQRVERIPYEIADFRDSTPADNRIYVPFWRLLTDFRIKSQDVRGGFFGKMGQALKGGDRGGALYIFVPAAHLETPAFRYWSVNLTINNPRYGTRNDFGGTKRMPAATNREEAIELADFVAVTLEAEKPGTLQYLDYSLTVNEAKVVYLPFVSSPSGLHLAL